MSKELEALKEIRKFLYGDMYAGVERRLDIIETAFKEKEKQDEILRIIKEKSVDIGFLQFSTTVERYNSYIVEHGWTSHTQKLTQTEFDLLKEVL